MQNLSQALPRPAPGAYSSVLIRLGNFLLWTFFFAAAYAQSPLYTSNQNQYYLHGLASAGFGALNRDWLANTLDPTPLFSLLVELTYRLLHSETITYIYYALLMGIYLFSLLGIVSLLFGIRSSRSRMLLFLALFMVIHSAGLRFALSRSLGINWTYVLEDGVADQRMLGPVFQPSVFGVLLALSIYLFLLRKPYLAVLAAVLAASFHPTYLLSAGVLIFAYMLVLWVEERSVTKTAAIGLVALIAIAPILFYVFRSFGGDLQGAANSQIAAKAQNILVHDRIPQHAVVSQWFDATAVVKILLVAAAIFLTRQTRLFLILLVSALAAAGLTALQLLLDSNQLALLFPWRLSIFLVPLSTAVILAYLVSRLYSLPRVQEPRVQRTLLVLRLGLISLAVAVGGIRFSLDLQRKINGPERPVEAYVAAHRSPDDLYLTPVKLQDFRLAAGAPVFIEFKSIPYKDSDVLEWYRRIRLVDQFYKDPSCERLRTLAQFEKITKVVFENDQTELTCSFMQKIYRDDFYSIYEMKTRSTTGDE